MTTEYERGFAAGVEAMRQAGHKQLNKRGLHASAKALLELPLLAPPTAPDDGVTP